MANDKIRTRQTKDVRLPPIPLTPEQALFAALNTKPLKKDGEACEEPENIGGSDD